MGGSLGRDIGRPERLSDSKNGGTEMHALWVPETEGRVERIWAWEEGATPTPGLYHQLGGDLR